TRPAPASPASSSPAPAPPAPPPETSPDPRRRSPRYPPRSLRLQTIASELFGRRGRPRSPGSAPHWPEPFPSSAPPPSLKICSCSQPPPHRIVRNHTPNLYPDIRLM